MISTIEEKEFILEPSDLQCEEWESFVLKYSECFFCTPAWTRVLDAGYKIRTKIYCLKRNGQILLGLPAALFDFGWFRLIHAYTPYGEFVGDQSLIPLFLKLLEKQARQEGIHQVRIVQIAPHEYPFDSQYHFFKGSQHILDLNHQTEASLWEGYKKNVRRDIRLSLKAGLTLVELKTLQEIDTYYQLYRKTMKRNKAFGPHPRRLYHKILEELVPQGQAVFFAAFYQKRMIGGVILICSGNKVYLLGNASDPDYLQYCPNDFLIHESLLFTLRKEFRYFDFMTAGEAFTEPGKLSAFKEKWGAKRYPFTVFEKDLSPLRVFLWNQVWNFAHSSLGGTLLRPLLNR